MDPILYAGIADLRTVEALSNNFLSLATDRNALPLHPALVYDGDYAKRGTKARKVPHIGWGGYDRPQVVADGALVPRTTLTTGSTTVAVARRSKSYAASDLARFTDPEGGILNAASFANEAAAAHMLALTDLIASLMGGFSNTAGSTGTDLSLANVLAALTLLEVGSKSAIPAGATMGVLHTVQAGDLRTAIATASAGALQWQAPAEQLVIKGNGYRGTYLGVDWFASDYVRTANSGADRAGAIFVRGAVVWADMSQQAEGADQFSIAGKVLFERDREGRSATTDYVSHSYFGASEGLDNHGVSIITDA